MAENDQSMRKEQQILLLGILSIVLCGLLDPVAWVQANTALRMIDEDGYDPVERNLVVAGQTCGMVGTGLLVLGLFVYLYLRANSAPQ
jgi:hypothetical protein